MGIFDRLKAFSPSNISQKFTDKLHELGLRVGLANNLSYEETVEQLQETNFGIASRPLASVWQSIVDRQETFRSYTRLSIDEIPDTNNFEAVDWITDKYGYVVEYDVYDLSGNFVGRDTSRLDTDQLLSKEQLFGLINENFYTSSGILLNYTETLQIKAAMRNDSFIED